MKIDFQARYLTVEWDSVTTSYFDSLWLLDNSPGHRDPSNGQRLIDITALPPDPQIASVDIDDTAIRISWRDVPAVTRFDLEWLRTNDPARQAPTGLPAQLWIQIDPFRTTFEQLHTNPRVRGEWLSRAQRDGLAFVSDVPDVESLASLAGLIQETNYGRIFDVRSVRNPANLADTDRGLGLHTDNPYRDPVPAWQLLHVVQSAPDGGGESLFADGFQIAARLRDREPAHFDLLTRTPVRFTYSSATAHVTARRCLIELSYTGDISAVHYNSRSIAPIELAAQEIRAFYAAYRAFAALLIDTEFQLRVQLEKHDAVLFNNRRILHGRTPFSNQTQLRHLRGCYLTADSVASSRIKLTSDHSAC